MDPVKTIVCQTSHLYQGIRKVEDGRKKSTTIFNISLEWDDNSKHTFQNKCYLLFRNTTKIGTKYNQQGLEILL